MVPKLTNLAQPQCKIYTIAQTYKTCYYAATQECRLCFIYCSIKGLDNSLNESYQCGWLGMCFKQVNSLKKRLKRRLCHKLLLQK